jgi:hypothetical protein
LWQGGDASVTTSAITRIAGTAVSITSNNATFVYGGDCAAGTRLITGEEDFSGTDLNIGETRQNTTTQWVMWLINHDAVSRTATVYSRCMDTPYGSFDSLTASRTSPSCAMDPMWKEEADPPPPSSSNLSNDFACWRACLSVSA